MELNDKNILVTGADGFIGSHLVEALVKKGAHVNALSYYNSFNNWGWLEKLENIDCLEDIRVIPGDVRDGHFINKITRGMDVIFNLAALIAIPYSYSAPDSYVETNIKGALNICQAALESGCQRIIQTSTSEVYGSARYIPMDENHPQRPQSPYSASKIGGDAMALSFYYSYELPVIIARPFNTYGPRQSARAVIPAVISQIAGGGKEIRLGNLSTTRDFNYVKDIVTGILQLAECDKAVGETVNIGSDTEISIGELVETIKKLMHSNAMVVPEETRFRPVNSEVARLKCDNRKIKELVGYTPQYTLEQGLAETIEWIAKNLENYKIKIYNV
ncbi:MAG: SDR family NAD(P)-dependent oxidoreductase [Candidatus Aminicenantes bacterium]|nr:SDR family NAD(P)-dependent oxidoreductase [Candidatus Aminicenantes bacterium]